MVVSLEPLTCSRYNETGHRDARSHSCKYNAWNRNRQETPRTTKRKQSDAQKAATKRQKAEGSRALRLEQRNEDSERCKVCVNANVYNDVMAHSNTASIFCPFHNINLADLKRAIYGTNQTTATRKVTLDKILKLGGQLEHDNPPLSSTETIPPSTTDEPMPLSTAETMTPPLVHNGDYVHNGDLIKAGGIFILGNLLATGQIKSGVLINVQGKITSGGDIYIKNDAIVLGNLACDGNVTVDAKILAGGNVFASHGTVCGGSLTSLDELTCESLNVSESLTAKGDIKVYGDMVIGQDLFFTEGDLICYKNATIGGNIRCTGRIIVVGTLNTSPTASIVTLGEIQSGLNMPFQSPVIDDNVVATSTVLTYHEATQGHDNSRSIDYSELSVALESIQHSLDYGDSQAAIIHGVGGARGEDVGQEGENVSDVIGEHDLPLIENLPIEDPPESSQDLRGMCPMMFSAHFMYGCIQLVIGKKVTNKNKKVPKHVMEALFDEYGRQFPRQDLYMEKSPHETTYSSSLVDLALSMATSVKNLVVETFENKCIRFLEHCLRRQVKNITNKAVKKLALYLYDRLTGATTPYWPTSIEKTDELASQLDEIVRSEDLGPKIAQQYDRNNQETTSELVDQVSTGWLYEQLQGNEDFKTMRKRKRQKVVKVVLQQINTNDGRPPHFSIAIPPALEGALSTLIITARSRIANSLLLKSGDTTIFRDDCLLSKAKYHSLFDLLPKRSFRMSFVTITINTLVLLLNKVVSDRPHVSTKKGIHRIREDSRKIWIKLKATPDNDYLSLPIRYLPTAIRPTCDLQDKPPNQLCLTSTWTTSTGTIYISSI
ncbi:hypothetical protein BC941DRAFT_476181 [Chlamydoabsidia padenii]|nr:hypothetical protein BC941DRAFT_476181 [Chlamydoabsidia padenii]